MAQINPSPFEINRVLAQNNPSGTSAVTAYTKPSNKTVTINNILVCNTDSSAHAYSIYICTNGTTYDNTTAIALATNIPANDTAIVDLSFTLDTANGTVGIKSSSANNLNFTILGNTKEHS